MFMARNENSASYIVSDVNFTLESKRSKVLLERLQVVLEGNKTKLLSINLL